MFVYIFDVFRNDAGLGTPTVASRVSWELDRGLNGELYRTCASTRIRSSLDLTSRKNKTISIERAVPLALIPSLRYY